ncbi:hypothetical protein, partial [Ligilactobacillus agilis]|uniref:hypothetical protein n=1 Tax=Ligilactobacillus agilis TaxID=1601 RepID=UPI001CDD4D8C
IDISSNTTILKLPKTPIFSGFIPTFSNNFRVQKRDATRFNGCIPKLIMHLSQLTRPYNAPVSMLFNN